MSVRSEIRRSTSLALQFLWPARAEDRSIPALDGGLAPNDRIDTFDVLWRSDRDEPDDLVVTADGQVLVSVGSDVLRIDPHSGRTTVAASLPGRVGALAADGDDDPLAFVDGVGLFRVPARGERGERLAVRVCDVPIACPTAMVVVGGTAYVAVGSADVGAEQWSHDLMTKGATGSLVEVDLATGRTQTLLTDLAWAGGVAADADGTLVVTESWRHRVFRLDPAMGAVTTLQPNLPGYPMRVAADGAGGFLLAFVALRTHLIDFVLREENYREQMVRTVAPPFWIAPALRVDGERWEPLQIGSMKHLNQTKPWAPSRAYGLLARMGVDGAFVQSWHARVGSPRTGIVAGRAAGNRVVVVCKGGRTVLATNEETR